MNEITERSSCTIQHQYRVTALSSADNAMYNYRQGEIHSAEFSDAFNKLCIPFEDSRSEEQIDISYKILDCVSETAAAEMRAAYKVGFKHGATMMQEIQD